MAQAKSKSKRKRKRSLSSLSSSSKPVVAAKRHSLQVLDTLLSPSPEVDEEAEVNARRRLVHKRGLSAPRVSDIPSFEEVTAFPMPLGSDQLMTTSSTRSEDSRRTPHDRQSVPRHVQKLSLLGTQPLAGLMQDRGSSGIGRAHGGRRHSLFNEKGSFIAEALSRATGERRRDLATIKVKWKNSTFMGCLSRPKWWIDGDFERIPNKIVCHSHDEIVVRAQTSFGDDMNMPIVGMLSFALDIDPRYAKKDLHFGSERVHTPFLNPFHHSGDRRADVPFYNGSGSIPAWMVGPGSLPFVPPSVLRVYEVYQEFAQKVAEQMEAKEERRKRREETKRRKERELRQKREKKLAKRSAKMAKEHVSGMKKFMDSVSPVKRTSSKARSKAPSPPLKKSSQKSSTPTPLKRSSQKSSPSPPPKTLAKRSSLKPLSTMPKPKRASKKPSKSTGASVIIKLDDLNLEISDSEDDSDDSDDSEDTTHELSSDESSDEDAEDDYWGWSQLLPPCFRVIVAWRIWPASSKRRSRSGSLDGDDSEIGDSDDGDSKDFEFDEGAFGSMLLRTSSLAEMQHLNQFNVAVFEDDMQKRDALSFDASSFDEVMRQALIADSEQCHEDCDMYEVTGTMGANAMKNEYTLCVDIDDGLLPSMWPRPLPNVDIPAMASFVAPMSYGVAVPRSQIAQLASALGGGSPKKQRKRERGLVDRRGATPVIGRTPTIIKTRAGGHSSMFSIDTIEAEIHTIASSPISSPRLSPMMAPPKRGAKGRGSVSMRRKMSTLSEFVSDAKVSTPSGIDYSLLSTGKRVVVDGLHKGQIKWVGASKATPTLVFGIRLCKAEGDSDGKFEGKRVFWCPPLCARFVSRHHISKLIEEGSGEDDFDYMQEDAHSEQMLRDCICVAKTWTVSKKDSALNSRSFKGLCLISGVEGDDEFVQDMFDGCLKSKTKSKMAVDLSSTADKKTIVISDLEAFKEKLKHKLGISETEYKENWQKSGEETVDPMEAWRAQQSHSQSERALGSAASQRTRRGSGKIGAKVGKKKDGKKRKDKTAKARDRSGSQATVYRPTGGAPRGVVVTRHKTVAIEAHEGYKHIVEAKELQEAEKLGSAIKKYKLGMAMLEVALLQIDRGLEKRKWKEAIASFRHAMNRCQYAIRDSKREAFIREREKQRKKLVAQKLREERQKQARKMQLTVAGLQSSATQPASDETTPVPASDSDEDDGDDSGSDEEIKGHTTAGGKELALPCYIPTKVKKHKKKGGKGKRQKGAADDGSGAKGGGEAEDGEDGGDGKKKPKYSKQDTELRARIASDVLEGGTSVSFQDVIGLNMVRLALFEHIILPIQRPDLFGHIPSSFGLLLFGPPGNGKTMIAKCVASEIKCTFFSISASSITSKFVGEAERIMRTLFDMARQRQPSIIFIDEIDSLLTARGGRGEGEASRRIKTEFLVQFDGVLSTEDADARVVVIGATNLPQQLDRAVLRRFPKRILVPNPECDARYGLLRLLCRKQRHSLKEDDFQLLADASDGYSGSDLTQMCQDAFMGPTREAMAKGDILSARRSDIPPLSYRHFSDSMANVRPSSSAESLAFYDKWDADYGSKLLLSPDVLPESMRPAKLQTVDEERRLRQEEELKTEFLVTDETKAVAET